MNTQTTRYTFGHSPTAADRLRIIADFFNPLAVEIIKKNLNTSVQKAADLGCGPGYTTDMLAKATQATQVIGFDISDYFLNIAKRIHPQYSFVQDDVTRLRSDNKYDYIYCRFLLSHLPDPENAIALWLKALSPGGILFIDELENIYTEVPVFKKYLQTNHELIRSQGSELYIGGHLNKYVNGHRCIESRSDTIPVADADAAGWFYPNTISIWKDEAYVSKVMNEVEREKISEELLRIRQRDDKTSNITWKMKRILLTT